MKLDTDEYVKDIIIQYGNGVQAVTLMTNKGGYKQFGKSRDGFENQARFTLTEFERLTGFYGCDSNRKIEALGLILFRLACPAHLKAAESYSDLPAVSESLHNEALKSPIGFRTFTEDDFESASIGCNHDEKCEFFSESKPDE